MKHALFLLALVVFGLSCTSSNTGIEGNLQYFTGAPAAGVRLVATTATNIKQELKRATRTAVSDANGRFIFTNTLPSAYYYQMTSESHFMLIRSLASEDEPFRIFRSIDLKAPQAGVAIHPRPVFVAPRPPDEGRWIYKSGEWSDVHQQIRAVDVHKRDNATHYPYSSGGVYWITEEDAEKAAMIPNESGTFLVIYEPAVQPGIHGLYHIDEKILEVANTGVFNKEPLHIQAGWYIDVTDFRSKVDGDVRTSIAIPRHPHIGSPTVDGNVDGAGYFAVGLGTLESGLYIVLAASSTGGFMFKIE